MSLAHCDPEPYLEQLRAKSVAPLSLWIWWWMRFGLVYTDWSLVFPKPNPRQEATFLAGPGWKYPFHLRPAAYGEMLISTTTSMGRTKILQFLPLRPPLGRTTKTCFCVGSDGYIRVECGSTHPSTRGYMILATTNPHSSPIQPNPHKSLQYLANHKVYIELNASFESILWQNPMSV